MKGCDLSLWLTGHRTQRMTTGVGLQCSQAVNGHVGVSFRLKVGSAHGESCRMGCLGVLVSRVHVICSVS